VRGRARGSARGSPASHRGGTALGGGRRLWHRDAAAAAWTRVETGVRLYSRAVCTHCVQDAQALGGQQQALIRLGWIPDSCCLRPKVGTVDTDRHGGGELYWILRPARRAAASRMERPGYCS